MMTSQRRNRNQSRGVGLIEALIALLVVAVGVVGLLKFQSNSRLNSDVARQRTEALKLAQNEIEQLRSGNAAADIQSANRSIAPDTNNPANATFQVAREVTASAAASKTVQVTVSWTDRSGAAQQVVISSVISAQPPALTGALAVAHRSADALPLNGRSADIPATAHDLGDGRSVLKLDSTQTDVYVFDNRSGQITSTCGGVHRHTRHIVVGDLTTCTTITAVLLSGQVRFSLTAPPDAARPIDAPLALSMSLTLSGGPYPRPAHCGAESMKTVSYFEDGQQRRAAVPLTATPTSWAVSSWVELGERFTAYHCVVVGKGTPAHWSGSLSVAPRGWALGNAANDFKVCRYTAQTPESYVDVSTSLAEQNFLVIRGDQLCPSASAVSTNGEGVQNFTNLATTAHAQ
jgi:type IV pilus modification protein PilV